PFPLLVSGPPRPVCPGDASGPANLISSLHQSGNARENRECASSREPQLHHRYPQGSHPRAAAPTVRRFNLSIAAPGQGNRDGRLVMPPTVAGLVFGLLIAVMLLLIAGSRAVSQWAAVMGFSSPVTSDLSSQYMDGSPLDRNVFTALLALGLIALVTRRRQVIAVLKANGAIVIFFLYCGLSVLWSDYSDVSFKRWIKSLGDLVM